MNNLSSDEHQAAGYPSVFEDLRTRLVRETPCRSLEDLLESVNAMERAQGIPDEFNLRFEEFVYRAEAHMAAVRSFFPALVLFLSYRLTNCGAADRRGIHSSIQKGFDPHNLEDPLHRDTTAKVA